MRRMWWALLLVLATTAHADQGSGRFIVHALDVSQTPVPDLVVTVVPQGGAALTAITDKDGRATFTLPPGAYEITAVYGSLSFSQQTITIEPEVTIEKTFRFDAKAATQEVTIKERATLAAPPMVLKKTLPRRLPYTDEAIDQNKWQTVWLLLHVSDRGNVLRAEVLKSPPDVKLDPVALDIVKKIRFRPALDDNGRPKAFKVLWKMDWEPYWAKRDRFSGKASIAICAGSGPANMNFVGTRAPIEYGYVDCTPPKGFEQVKLVPVEPDAPDLKRVWHDPGRRLPVSLDPDTGDPNDTVPLPNFHNDI